jgi:hypothetical protein
MKFLFFILSTIVLPNHLFAQHSFGLGTEVPMGVHAEYKYQFLETNYNAKIRLGTLIKNYTNLMNSVAQDFDFYNQETGDLISEALDGAQQWEISMGWKPDPASSHSFDIGYMNLKGSGTVTGAQIAAAVAGITLPGGGNEYDIKSEINSLTLRYGYTWPIPENMHLIAQFGLMKPINSESKLNREVSGPIQQALLEAANEELNNYMKDVIETDAVIPLLSLNFYYSF